MRILGLDLSTKSGYAVVEKDVHNQPIFLEGGTVFIEEEKDLLGFEGCAQDFADLRVAELVAEKLSEVISRTKPNLIYIEQTNRGINRTSQKLLEFVHCKVLSMIHHEHNLSTSVGYIDTSYWRKALKIRLSKEQAKHNKLVKQKKARGKITTKHLAVDWVNSTFNLELKLKDNDQADAIAVAVVGLELSRSRRVGFKEYDKLLDEVFK